MIITCTLITDPTCFVRFTWTDDMADCCFVSGGASDDAVDALIAADGHMGVMVAGWVTVAA
jgi:hypothetical protein